MGDEWSATTLGEIAAGGQGLVDGPFGSNLPASDYVESGVPVIRGGNLSLAESRFHAEGFVYVSDETAARLARSLCSAADIIFTKKGTIGQTGIIPDHGKFDRYLLSSNQMKLTVDTAKADSLFVYYYVSSAKSRSKIIRDASVTGVPKTNVKYFRSFPIRLPPRAEQRAIAHILGTLDDKIELNRRMNETLEGIARALFKSWFVDFDPVRAKLALSQTEGAEGRLPAEASAQAGDMGLPPHIAELFPDRFEPSELGEIPAGWEVQRIGDLLELAYGKALRAGDRQQGSVPVYGSNGPIGWHDVSLIAGPAIIVGRKGNPGTVTWSSTTCFPIDTTFYVAPKAEGCLHFLFHALQNQDLAALAADSAVPGLNRNLAYMSTQVVPPVLLLEEFEKRLTNLSERIYQSDAESRTLAAVRDALLPKLISGEVRVKDAERFAQEAV